jgi:hypothetical protein
MLRSILLLAFLVAACGGEQPAPPPAPETRAGHRIPEKPAANPDATPDEDNESGDDAADVLKRYYARIEGGDYDSAWAMRVDDPAGRERFVANFKAYERYRAAVGTPSTPVEQRGWSYVEVPVMITGRYKGGAPFATSGSVSMRRAVSAEAGPRERRWHIVTRD